MSQHKGYEFFEHTADTGLRVEGQTLEELLVRAAKGLTELLVEDSAVAARETRAIMLRAESAEALLLAWLKELLYWFNTDRFVLASVDLQLVGETQLQGSVAGERFDPAKHAAGTEVKGVTYHQLHVEHTPQGWEAQVIFDV